MSAPQEVKAPDIPAKETQPGTRYSVSPGLAARLSRLRCALAFTSYQSSLLNFVGCKPEGGLNVHAAAMPRPMGHCRDGETGLILTAGWQILRFENVLEPDQRVNGLFDIARRSRKAASSQGACCGPPASGIARPRISIITILSIQVVPHFCGVTTKMSSGRSVNQPQTSVSVTTPRYSRRRSVLSGVQRQPPWPAHCLA